ncbi:MAG: LacI family DNA-binding transcriptional regulator [Acidobacteria bacterium]|nr:LacI family DNA-binding transcriptional regulator [Acidobacteriota bacterium]
MGKNGKVRDKHTNVVTLKMVADYVGLTPGTVSAVLNAAPSSHAIPPETKKRIHTAAKKLNYRPNFFARSLRQQRTYTVGVIAEEIGDAYGAMVISGFEEYLRKKDYFFLTVVHRHDPELLQRYSLLLQQRRVEGFITVDTVLEEAPALPTVAVAGHNKIPGVTNVVLDQRQAARLALTHLQELGHEQIAFMKGNPLSADARSRWQAISQVAGEIGIEIHPALTVQIDFEDPSPHLGYPFAKQLLARGRPFTALFAYNDHSALGSIRAFQEHGLRVPEDISVVGFDDIPAAAYNLPSLTTVRQPLRRMGQVAAEILIRRIEGWKEYPALIAIEPEFVVRESTGPAAAHRKGR